MIAPRSVTLREALALWRGDAFGEFRAIEACDAEARRLEEMRLVAVEDRLDAELAAGAASEVVAELESLVAQHEFRERLWAQLMLALYRSGRQRDALGAYRRARTVLVEQMGIEPGRELRALEAAILEQDPALDLTGAVAAPFGLPSPLESVGPAFVGRDAELAWLRTAWLDAADGRGGFVSVLGPEGMGKTRLLAELAREVQRSGGVVLYARCGVAGSGIRALLRQALGDAGSSLDGARWRAAGRAGPDGDADAGDRVAWPAGAAGPRRRPPRRRRHDRGARRPGRVVRRRVAARRGDVPDRRRRT